MTDTPILSEQRDGVLHLTLNRPEKRNALSEAIREELVDRVQAAGADPEIGAVVIKGAGPTFCAGADISPVPGRASPYERSLQDDIASLRHFAGRWSVLWNLNKPVLAQVHGYCIGVGTDLALNCDIVIAAEDAQFGFPPVRAQGSPATHMWTYLVGPQWAKRLLLTGDLIDGKTAAQIGLVLKAVPAAQLEEEVTTLARRMALVPRDLQATNKGICNRALELMGRGLLQQLAAEADAIGHKSPAAREFAQVARDQGLRAALEWRDGKFRT
jgi:enoyl-CoA hydratase